MKPGFSAEERRWRCRRGEFWQDYVRMSHVICRFRLQVVTSATQVTQATHGQARRCLRVALILFTGNVSEENRHSFRRNFEKNLNSFGFRKNQNSFRKFFGKFFKSFGNRLKQDLCRPRSPIEQATDCLS